MENILNKLLERLNDAEKIVFMGIGENKMTDDGIGPYIATNLLEYSNDKFLFMNANIDPMARIDQIEKFNPSHIIVLDTCTLNKPPGTVAILERENIKDHVPISSHTIPIHVVLDLLKNKIDNLDVFMIGVVPKSLEGFSELKRYKEGELTLEEINENEDLPLFDFQLTETIQKVADNLIQIIEKIVRKLS
ncbi:MAG: Hydrogenase 3 maturation protease [Promethearchaeota archaeon]|nr:MAG: Hydrogenase 3 maturation protease [Candidatus Lokiarchaeota archaeon]